MSIHIHPSKVRVEYTAGTPVTVPVRVTASGDTDGCRWSLTKLAPNVTVTEPEKQKDGSVLFDVTSPPNAGFHQITLVLSDGRDRQASIPIQLVGQHGRS